MVHGMPDYGIYASKSTVVALEDMAELAARLGGVVTYDRRGDVIFIDDYEAPIKKFREDSAVNCGVKLDSQYAFSGAQSALLYTDGTINRFANLIHTISPFVLGRHGIKISVSPYELASYDGYYEIEAYYYSGAHELYWGVRIYPYTSIIKYMNESKNYVEFEDALDLSTYYETFFHNIKLVVDLDTGKYVRLMIDAVEWDMTAYSCSKLASALASVCEVSFKIMDLEGHAHQCWQDDFIYTINEP